MAADTLLASSISDLVIANRILASEGVLDAFGHISIRHPNNPERYFMACSRSPALVSQQDIMEYTLASEPIHQAGRAMYAERYIHGSLYQERPDVFAVCHNHAHDLLPFSVTGTPLRPITHMSSVIGATIPIWDIRSDFGDTDLLVTNPAKALSLTRCLGPQRVALMRGHGSVVTGASVREVVFTSIYLHLNAAMILKAKILGEINYLSDGEIKLASAQIFGETSQNRAWEFWAARVGIKPTETA